MEIRNATVLSVVNSQIVKINVLHHGTVLAKDFVGMEYVYVLRGEDILIATLHAEERVIVQEVQIVRVDCVNVVLVFILIVPVSPP